MYPGEIPGTVIRGTLKEVIEQVKRAGYVPKSREVLNVYVTLSRPPFVTPVIYFEHLQGNKQAILFSNETSKSEYELRACPNIN